MYRGRRSQSIETPELRVTVLEEGGHIAEICDKQSGVNPLWTPPWTSIEPSTYDRAKHPEYGADAESRLLAGIMGHNLCLDLFGAPEPAEAADGMTVHGEAPVACYEVVTSEFEITAQTILPVAQLRFERRISLRLGARVIRISETVENLSTLDRPIAWTQHVTLGPPFLVPGSTQFRATATRSKVFEQDFPNGNLKSGAEFDWPYAPRIGGGFADLRTYSDAPVSAGFTAQLMDPRADQVWFSAFSPESRLLFGYMWKRSEFPWLGIWDENRSRQDPPWNGRTLTRGMEFGVSPMPESRRAMIDRGSLFGEPTYRWIAARETLRAEYRAFLMPAECLLESAPISE